MNDYDRETGDVRIPVGRGLPTKSRTTFFDEEIKTDVGAELDQFIARARLNFQKVIPFDPDVHPDRIRFGEVNTREG